jgi:hypothetical protein
MGGTQEGSPEITWFVVRRSLVAEQKAQAFVLY